MMILDSGLLFGPPCIVCDVVEKGWVTEKGFTRASRCRRLRCRWWRMWKDSTATGECSVVRVCVQQSETTSTSEN